MRSVFFDDREPDPRNAGMEGCQADLFDELPHGPRSTRFELTCKLVGPRYRVPIGTRQATLQSHDCVAQVMGMQTAFLLGYRRHTSRRNVRHGSHPCLVVPRLLNSRRGCAAIEIQWPLSSTPTPCPSAQSGRLSPVGTFSWMTLTHKIKGSTAPGRKRSENVVQMWCGAVPEAPREAEIDPSNRPDLDFYRSGRRDSNPRPSPWQGGDMGPPRLPMSSGLRFRPPSVH